MAQQNVAQPLVSVIVPLYNKAAEIVPCLESILAQTLLVEQPGSVEIMVVDDGSTDRGLELVRGLAAKEPAIRVLCQTNAGPSSARNAGIAAASGEYLTFVDSDDTLVADALSHMLALARLHSAPVVRCKMAYVRTTKSANAPMNGSRWSAQVVQGATLYRRLFEGTDISLMTACAALYARGLVESHHLRFDEKLRHTEDALFSAQVYATNVPIVVSSARLYRYLQIRGTLGRTPDPDLSTSADRLWARIRELESAGGVAGKSASDGHAHFLGYLQWYYTLALADLQLLHSMDVPSFRRACETVLDSSDYLHAFAQAELEGVLFAPPSIVWRTLSRRRFDTAWLLLFVFNFARAVRRAIRT